VRALKERVKERQNRDATTSGVRVTEELAIECLNFEHQREVGKLGIEIVKLQHEVKSNDMLLKNLGDNWNEKG